MARLTDWLHAEFGQDFRTMDEHARVAARCRDGYVVLMNMRCEYNPAPRALHATREEILRHVMENAAKELALIALEREDGHTESTAQAS